MEENNFKSCEPIDTRKRRTTLCQETGTNCVVCGEIVKACLQCDEYFTCAECGNRSLIDKEDILEKQRIILKKVFGEKPKTPENN